MSRTINSKVAGGGGLTEPDRPVSASTVLECSPVLDLCILVGDLADAISVVTMVYRFLAALEIPAAAEEDTALRHALSLLRFAYSAFDIGSCRASS